MRKQREQWLVPWDPCHLHCWCWLGLGTDVQQAHNPSDQLLFYKGTVLGAHPHCRVCPTPAKLTHFLSKRDIPLPRRQRAEVVGGGGAEFQAQMGAGATCMRGRLPKLFSGSAWHGVLASCARIS